MSDDLINNLEAATGSDGLLDCKIRAVVEGWKNVGGGWREWPDGRREQYDYGFAKPYTASLDAAVSLVPSGWSWIVEGNRNNTGNYARVFNDGLIAEPSEIFHGSKPPAIALCIAALKARATMTQDQR